MNFRSNHLQTGFLTFCIVRLYRRLRQHVSNLSSDQLQSIFLTF